MLDQNKAIHEFTGVSRFHAAGYTGSRVAAATGEALKPGDWPGPGHVETLVDGETGENTSHCLMTTAVFFEVAPDAILYRASNNAQRNSDGTYTYDLYDVMIPQMEQLGICQMFTSMAGAVGANEVNRAEEFYAENDWFIPFHAAGNNGEDAANGRLKLDGTVGVAAYTVEDGKAIPTDYSSESEYVDFAAPTNIAYKLSTWTRAQTGTGTSAATPYLCGMACLVQDFFIDKTGAPLNRDALIRFFKDNCIDLESTGHDNKTGYGAVVLPDPDTIDVWAYQDGGDTLANVDDFTDAAQISDWAKDSVQTCLDLGIMEGVGNGMFDPKGTVTREQLATVLARALQKMV